MQDKNVRNRGAVSVYLALMLTVMIPLIFTMMEGVRINAVKTASECAVELSLNAVLAEYDRELLKQYDLLFINTAYDSKTGDLKNITDHLKHYVNENLDTGNDMLKLSLEDIECTAAARATDEDGAVFRYMALSYMLEKYGIAYAQDAFDMIKSSESSKLFTGNIEKEEAEAQKKLDDYKFEVPQVDDGNGGKMDDPDWEEPEKADPASKVNSGKKKGILKLSCEGELSKEAVDTGVYASHRDLVKGNGMCSDWDKREGLIYDCLFNEYIMEKTGDYRNEKEGSVLKYETEYVIAGRSADSDNLKAVAEKILLLRGASNTLYYATDKELTGAASTMAATLSAATGTAVLEPLYKTLISAAWIYAESVSDVKEIMNGGKVPLLKKKSDWKLSMENALAFKFDGLSETEDKGLDYEDHLRIFLYTLKEKERTGRMIDIVEMNIRASTENENFRMDDCIAAAAFTFKFRSAYGYDVMTSRTARYM